MVLPERTTMRDCKQRNVFLPTITVHEILDIDTDGARALIQNRKLRFVIK